MEVHSERTHDRTDLINHRWLGPLRGSPFAAVADVN